MYDIVSAIIDHAYVTNYSGDQQYIYNICAALICILTVAFIDALRSGFRAYLRK